MSAAAPEQSLTLDGAARDRATDSVQVSADLDALWPARHDLSEGQQVRVGSRVIERTVTGWAVWQPSTRAYCEPREIGGYSRETAWGFNDRGLLRELRAEAPSGTLSEPVALTRTSA